MRQTFLLFLFGYLLSFNNLFGQISVNSTNQVGVGTPTIPPGVKFQIFPDFVKGHIGFLKPTMTTAQRLQIETLPEGTEVYDINEQCTFWWANNSWKTCCPCGPMLKKEVVSKEDLNQSLKQLVKDKKIVDIFSSENHMKETPKKDFDKIHETLKVQNELIQKLQAELDFQKKKIISLEKNLSSKNK